jgi:hypothetical protein
MFVHFLADRFTFRKLLRKGLLERRLISLLKMFLNICFDRSCGVPDGLRLGPRFPIAPKAGNFLYKIGFRRDWLADWRCDDRYRRASWRGLSEGQRLNQRPCATGWPV